MPDKLLDDILGEQDLTPDQESVKLAPLINEIEMISDNGIKLFVRSLLFHIHDGFWTAPASFSGMHHPPDERGEGGNVLHTKRVARTILLIAKAQERSQFEKDILLAAALLHDLTKAVTWQDGSTNYDSMHPYTVDPFVDFVRHNDEFNAREGISSTLYIEEDIMHQILRLIRCHMGAWSPIPETIPITSLEWTMHLADYLASNIHVIADGE